MQSCGMSPEGLDRKTDEPMIGASLLSGSPTSIKKKEEPCVIETPSNGEEEISVSLKRQKVRESEEERQVPVKATESLLIEWLKNNDGVSEMKSEICIFFASYTSDSKPSLKFTIVWFK